MHTASPIGHHWPPELVLVTDRMAMPTPLKMYFSLFLQSANEFGTYPSTKTLLHIFATLPVTTSTTERSFSALKYIKNYLRSTMNENRLNGLAHLYINRDIELDYADVIDEFSKTHHRLNFQ